ncbi:CBO0543 family protein [Peribacillus sp. Hz7]|uniref:CBO0543 family protein n=1 Tax=Peribacillus sp. Hz7 TaxID=3344873 RepID=UPI0035CC3D2F
MANQFEKNTIRLSFFIGIVSFLNLIRKPPLKDWLIIFLLKGYIASILDNILVKKGYLKYPVNLFKSFDISVLFSYVIFPVMCIYFNQVTKKSNILGILTKCFIFTFPAVVAELWLEKNTKLITYKKSWTGIHSFISIASTFLIVRFLITLIRKSTEKQSG